MGINNVQIDLYSKSSETLDVHLVVAAYESGTLTSLAIEKYSITPNQGTAKAGVMINKVTENTVVKAFIIEDFTTMRPIK